MTPSCTYLPLCTMHMAIILLFGVCSHNLTIYNIHGDRVRQFVFIAHFIVPIRKQFWLTACSVVCKRRFVRYDITYYSIICNMFRMLAVTLYSIQCLGIHTEAKREIQHTNRRTIDREIEQTANKKKKKKKRQSIAVLKHTISRLAF